MSDTNVPVISKENQPTVIAVVFILTLLALTLAIYTNHKISTVAKFYGQVSVVQARGTAQVHDQANQIADLEARLKVVETQLAATAAALGAPAVEPTTK